jgi:hypothetical protein
MQKSQAIEHFGGITKMAAKLGISRQAIHAWPEIVPSLWQYKLHHLSEGRLPIDDAPQDGRDERPQ